MAHETLEIYVRDLSEEAAADWLGEVLEDLTRVQEGPIVTYEGLHEGTSIPVQITEGVKNGPYTSLWFNAPDLPWDSGSACARAAHEALGAEVLYHLDRPEDPWTLFRMQDGEEQYVDQREMEDL